MTITELDTIRANEMKRLLNSKGRNEIWKYDVITNDQALREALQDYDFDNIEIDVNSTKQYCLVGPGICDCVFDTADELKGVLAWLCGDDGYLGCYKS